ncbi:MAG: uroporphyrinogen-III C-methyltransferase, partial [bacterium]
MKGSVILIGAGPGSPDLITLRGLRALRRADLVVIDKLLSPDFLDELGVAGPETVWLGADETRRSQDEINRLLVRAARDGKTVVRLKCGDPFVFGRGGEETDYLDGHGVPWELVPGLTAGTAAPSNAGLALTDRRRGRSFAAATARRAGGEVSDEFPRADSLLIFMGVAALAEVAERLIAGGRPRGTAATVIERATLPWERRVSGPLDRVAGLAEQRGVRSPAMLLVGAVAEQADRRPTILYTGLDPANFRALGDIIHWPALCVVRDDEAAAELPAALDGLRERAFDTVVFTSRVGVRSFFRELAAAGLDARSLDGTTVVTAGTGTDRTLREFGVAADIVPDDAGSRGIVRGLAEGPGERVLLVQGT